MSEQQERLRRRGALAHVGELLLDGHAECVEELGAFIIAYGRINKFFAGLKRGTADVKPGKSVQTLLEQYHQVHVTLGVAFERASAELLSAEWPTSRPDVWREKQVRLSRAVRAFTERLVNLHAEYEAS